MFKDWIITEQQAAAIKNFDIEARNKFFNDNYARIKKTASVYVFHCYEKGLFQYDVGDLVNQLYLDLPYLNYSSQAYFFYTVRRAFFYSVHGGFSFLKESHNKLLSGGYQVNPQFLLDAPVKNDKGEEGKTVFLDYFAHDISAEDVFFSNRKDFTEEIKTILSPYLSPKQFEYISYKIDGYIPAEISRKMGLKLCSRLHSHVVVKLRKNCAEILEKLASVNCSAVFPYFKSDFVRFIRKELEKHSAFCRKQSNEAYLRNRSSVKEYIPMSFRKHSDDELKAKVKIYNKNYREKRKLLFGDEDREKHAAYMRERRREAKKLNA